MTSAALQRIQDYTMTSPTTDIKIVRMNLQLALNRLERMADDTNQSDERRRYRQHVIKLSNLIGEL